MSTHDLVLKTPVMEQFNLYAERGLRCSIDRHDEAVPTGAKNFFERHGYLVIENLYNPSLLYCPVPAERGQLEWWGKQEDQFNFSPTEQQVAGSLARYGHPMYLAAHTAIRLILEDIIGEKLYSSYYYDRFYFAGQELKRHSDRDACEVSVSVQISTNRVTSWPFCIQTRTGENHAINLENGWGMVYMGCEREHWRSPLKSRHSSLGKIANKILCRQDDTYHHQIFFHYVRANGLRAQYAWDRAR